MLPFNQFKAVNVQVSNQSYPIKVEKTTTIKTIVFIFLANYSSTVKSKQVELKESCSKINNFNKEEERIANEKTSNEVKFNKLIMLESQNQEKIDKRNVMLVENAKLAGKILYGLQVSTCL